MEESEQDIQYLDSILDKEQEELLQSKRQHHTDWDNHILTLSTASIGFTFAFLPIVSGSSFSLLVAGVFSFIFAICFTTSNYIIADNGFNKALDSLTKRRLFNLKFKQAIFELNKKTSIANQETDEDAYKLAQEKFDKDVKKLFREVDFDAEIEEKDKINKKITFLNHAKTYSFIIGIFFIVTYSLINIDKLTK